VADQVDEPAHAQACHDLARFLGDHEQIVHDVLGLARELLPQHRILRGNADRAGVQVALAHHDAAQRDQWRRGETHLLGTEQRGDHDVAASLDAAIGLEHCAAAQVVHHERLVSLGDAELPRHARVLDARERRGTRATVVAGDEHMVRMCLHDTGRDRAHSNLGHELHADARRRVRVLQVVNQLREILDRIDVMVRRRADQAHARRRVPDARDVVVDLLAGQLAAFTGLRALRHLDLELVRVREIPDRDAEAAGRDLLDSGPARVAVRQRQEPRRILATFAGVALAADAVHRDGERLVRLGRQ